MDLINGADRKQRNIGLFLLIFLFMLSKYNLYIGFALKPYMIFLALFLLFYLSAFSFRKLYSFECVLLLFYLVYSFTGAFSAYPFVSIRLTLGIVLLLFCYFVLKSFLATYSERAIQKAIAGAGLLFNAVSLILYVIGLKSLGFQAQGGMVTSYGVLLDRNYPRLIGLSEDPNLYVFYNTIFFIYFLTNMRSLRNKIGFGLCLTTTTLTLSRGGILAILLIILMYVVVTNPAKNWKTLTTIGGIFLTAGYLATSIMKFDIGRLLEGRIADFSSDGGSGRFELWGRAWEYFLAHPVMGIGADNFIEYNKFYYGENLYTHNTFLQVLTESGLLGFALYSAFLLLVFIQLVNSRFMQKKPYLFLSFFAILLQMVSLSLIINEVFFLYLAILSVVLQQEKRAESTDKETQLVTRGA